VNGLLREVALEQHFPQHAQLKASVPKSVEVCLTVEPRPIRDLEDASGVQATIESSKDGQ
jgi:hypothetical protein